jgi:hypothetical protein
MTPIPLEILKRLELWFASHCDGEWEHSAGISISSLDNPGWSLHIDISETTLSKRAFPEIKIEGPDSQDWYVCRLRDGRFEGFCGPLHLTKVLEIFLDWAEVTV